MRDKRRSPALLPDRCEGKSKSHLRLYKTRVRNAMIKGSAFGAFALWFISMLAFDANVPGALFTATLALTYFALFVLVNKDRIGG